MFKRVGRTRETSWFAPLPKSPLWIQGKPDALLQPESTASVHSLERWGEAGYPGGGEALSTTPQPLLLLLFRYTRVEPELPPVDTLETATQSSRTRSR